MGRAELFVAFEGFLTEVGHGVIAFDRNALFEVELSGNARLGLGSQRQGEGND